MDKNDIKKAIKDIFNGYGLGDQEVTLQVELCRFINQFGDDRFTEGFDSAIAHYPDIPEEIGGLGDDEDDENYLLNC